MFGASHGRCGSTGSPTKRSRSAEVLESSFLQKNPAFRLRSMTGIFLCVVEAEHAPTDVKCWFCVRFVESRHATTLRCVLSL